jgi:hypothetical protein
VPRPEPPTAPGVGLFGDRLVDPVASLPTRVRHRSGSIRHRPNAKEVIDGQRDGPVLPRSSHRQDGNGNGSVGGKLAMCRFGRHAFARKGVGCTPPTSTK